VTDYEYSICIYFVGCYFFWLFLVFMYREVSSALNPIYGSVALFC
jgi:hypothetical protein